VCFKQSLHESGFALDRTLLRLPWKPLIDVDGSTLYVVDANSKVSDAKQGHGPAWVSFFCIPVS
jgi:hypothetical protein